MEGIIKVGIVAAFFFLGATISKSLRGGGKEVPIRETVWDEMPEALKANPPSAPSSGWITPSTTAVSGSEFQPICQQHFTKSVDGKWVQDLPPHEWTTAPSMEGLRLTADQVVFCPSEISVNLVTGEVVVPEGLKLDEASRELWEALKKLHTQHKP